MFSRVDKPLLITIAVLLLSGLLFFGSAALGVLATNEGKFFSVLENQLVFALVGGAIALYVGAHIPYMMYQKYAKVLFGGGLFATILVFVPGLSVYHGGAHRWIDIGPLTAQPSELLKFTLVVFVAYWCSTQRHNFKNWKIGLLPYLGAMALVTIIMLAQPDFGTYLVMATSSFFTYFVGGARKNHLLILGATALVGLVLLIAARPYMLERVKTFVNNEHDPRGASYQLNQSLIALGGGGILGRGLGQSVQKFHYLPEPIGDSIFAVIGEELGFLGALYIITLYAIIGARGFFISIHAGSQFGRLLAIGIASIVAAQAALNITSILGLAPLTGVPLPLISHGGTALMVVLFELGVLLNISKSTNNVSL